MVPALPPPEKPLDTERASRALAALFRCVEALKAERSDDPPCEDTRRALADLGVPGGAAPAPGQQPEARQDEEAIRRMVGEGGAGAAARVTPPAV